MTGIRELLNKLRKKNYKVINTGQTRVSALFM